MIVLRATSDVLRVVTLNGSADIRAHVSAMEADNSTPPVIQDIVRTNTASIATATTTTILDCTTANRRRNVKLVSLYNAHASATEIVRVEHYDGTTAEPLARATLLAGETLECDESGLWTHFDVNGGAYVALPQNAEIYNNSTASQGAGFSSDTYLTNSSVLIPSVRPKAGTLFRCRFHAVKTAAGTATPIISLRYGTNASTADTAICAFTFAAGTAAADEAWWEVVAVFRSVGSGTSAVVAGCCNLTSNLTTTGFSNAKKVVQATSSGFDSTTASTYLGVSVNGGASASWTVQLVCSTLENYT